MNRIKVEGRSDDTLFLEDDCGEIQAHPPVPFEALMLRVPGLKQYQLIHRTQNNIEVCVVAQEAADGVQVCETVRTTLEDFFATRGITKTLKLEVGIVTEIERDPTSHKIRQIYSEV